MTTTTATTTATERGRPPLPRFRADVVLVVELGAVDEDDADERIATLVDAERDRLERLIRNANGRKGTPRLVHVQAVDSGASAV